MNDVGRVLESVAGDGPLLTLQPGGNYGDTLIYRGFETIVEATDIDRRPFASGENRYDAPPIFPTTDMRRNVRFFERHARYLRHRIGTDPAAVYINGGGNFNDIWKTGVYLLRLADRYFDCPVVVGPQSCRFERADPRRIFNDLSVPVVFFAREKYSYRMVREATRELDDVAVRLTDDTALALTRADLPVGETGSEYTLVAIRSDPESASPLLEEDLSAPVRVSDVSVTADSFEAFVDAVARAESVHTDRLHVAILATLLETPVTWYEVGYHKSRGVYEFSLADRESVTFVYRDDQ